jgi:hypothetical protein
VRGTPTAVGFGVLRGGYILALILALTVAPAVHAQAAQRTPDPGLVALSPQDLDGWTQTDGIRDETWNLANAAAAPGGRGDMYSYETDYTQDLSDGRQLVLSSVAAETTVQDAQKQFQGLAHDALGQTPINLPALGDQSVGWWESAGDTRQASAAAELGNLLLEVHVTGVQSGDDVSDAQVAMWLSRMMDRAIAAPDAAPQDWTQVLPGQPRPWSLILDSASTGADWQQSSGLELVSHELGGETESLSASRDFTRNGSAIRRTLTSMATDYSSESTAIAQMTGPGTSIGGLTLGDQSAAFQSSDDGEGHDTPTVTYTVDVRHGPEVTTTQETGVRASLDSPSETEALAVAAEARASTVLAEAF